jgi:hypothetical protein
MGGLLQSQPLLVFLFLALWVAAFAALRRYWRRTQAGQEWLVFNGRLNLSVRRRVASIRWMFLIALTIAVMLTAVYIRHHFHPDETLGDASPLAVALIVVSSYFAALYPATLLTNVIWWLTPSMRDASNYAKVGLGAVTFRNGIVLLTVQAAVVIPICLVQIYMGSVMR